MNERKLFAGETYSLPLLAGSAARLAPAGRADAELAFHHPATCPPASDAQAPQSDHSQVRIGKLCPALAEMNFASSLSPDPSGLSNS